MGKMIEIRGLQPGNIVNTERGGRFIVLHRRFGRRGGIKYTGAYEEKAKEMLKDPTDTSKMQFYTVTSKRNMIELLGQASPSVVKKLAAAETLLQDVLYKKSRANMDKLDLKWNKDAQTTTRYGAKKGGGIRRYFKGAYDVVTVKGEHVSAGDLVMVQFSNGKFEMVMGNRNGQTYDPSTGNFLSRDKRAVERAAWRGKEINARSMPPETLLYLISKKTDAVNKQ